MKRITASRHAASSSQKVATISLGEAYPATLWLKPMIWPKPKEALRRAAFASILMVNAKRR